MKKQFLALILSVIVTIPAFSQVKVGFMNPNEVLTALDEVAEIEAQIQTLIETRDQELLDKTTQLQQDLASYEEGKSVMSADARAQREQEFLDRNTALEEERENALNEIRQKRAQMMTPIVERMDVAIKNVAASKGLELVLNEGTSYGDAIIFYSSDQAVNITQDVIAELKAE
jgi:Skp family chaperone for outer membrane proteins